MKRLIALFACAACGVAFAAVCADEVGGALADIPWIGDGRPEPANAAAFYDEDPAPEFRAEFVLPKGKGDARIDIAAAGFYRLTLNGRDAGPGAGAGIAPLWSPFDHTIYADSIEPPSGTLRPWPATNILSVTLGNGFYNLPPLLFWGQRNFRSMLAHGRPCFKLAVEGVEAPIEWKWCETRIVRNCVYLGAEVDMAREAGAAWRSAAKVEGPKGRIVRRRAPPTVPLGEPLRGKSRWIKPGVQVVDFGKNLSGCPRFTFKGQPRGRRIEIVYGERLNADGTVNVLTQTAGQVKRAGMGGPGAPDVACQRDLYVCGGGAAETFAPVFTWHICRYAEVRGCDSLAEGGDALFTPISSDLRDAPAAKAFKASDPDFARIHEICRRTFLANMIGGVQSDCPGRERLGYGGDIVATCEAFILNWDMREFYLKALQDFADEAADDGWITETAPYVGISAGNYGPRRAGPVSWALAVPVLMDALIRHYPDVKGRALAFYPVCARYLRLLDAKFPDGIVPRCIGDHEALERAPNDAVATAHAHEFARLTLAFAKTLGREGDVWEFTAVEEKIRKAFAAKYVKGGVVANGTQSAQALGLYLGLVPPEQVAAAEKALVAAIEAKGCAPTTGIFTTRYMLMYLSEHGRLDLAERIVRHRGFPGWMHMIDRGATTLWETWKESDNVYSNCHPMFGSVDEWILRFAEKCSACR